MVNPNQSGEPPKDFPSVPPTEMGGNAAQTRLLINAIESQVADLRSDVKDIKDHRHPDFVWMITVFGGGFLFLLIAFAYGYLNVANKIDTQIAKTAERDVTLARIETKLDDLIARVPPIQTPVTTK